MKENKRISICIAAHNPNDYLVQELESIMPQLKECDEVIISEDSSIENSIYQLIKQRWERVTIIKSEQIVSNPWQWLKGDFKGYAVTNNFLNAILHARGEYIFLADQDDIWSESRVETVLNTLKKNKGTLVVYNADIINKDGNLTKHVIRYSNPLNISYPILQCIKRPPFLGCTMAFDRTLLEEVLPFPNKLNSHDSWITLVALKCKKIVVIPFTLHYYRIHNNNVSGNINNSMLFKVVYRIYLLFSIFTRRINVR